MSDEGALQGEELRKALLTALTSAYKNGSLHSVLREVMDESPKASNGSRPREEAIRAAGVGVDDLLADFDSPRDPSDAAEVSFDLSPSNPSNEESGGFFISTGGGGLNLPLDDDDDAFKERCNADAEEDLTEETRRVYLLKGEDGPAGEATQPVGIAMDDPLEASLEPPVAPPEEAETSGFLTISTLTTTGSEIKTFEQDHREEMWIRLHDRLLAKQSVMQCVLKGLLNVQAREMVKFKASLEEEPKIARVEEEVAPEGLDEAADSGRRFGRGSKSFSGKKRRTVTSTVRSPTTSGASSGSKASPRSTIGEKRPEGVPKRRASKVTMERLPQSPPEGVENSSRPTSRSSQRSDREEEPEREADAEAVTGPTEGMEEVAEAGQEDVLVDDQGIGVCEVSEAEFQLLFDAGVLYQAYGFYPQQPVGFSFNIPSFGEERQIPSEVVTAETQAEQEWCQPNPTPQHIQQPGGVDPMYYQQYQYQNAMQMQQMQQQQQMQQIQQQQMQQMQQQQMQSGIPQYQYPYYQQTPYAYGNPQPYGNSQMYQQPTNRPSSQQAQTQSGATNQASKDTDSPPGSEGSEAEAEGDKEAESPKTAAKNPKKAKGKGKAAAKTKVRKPVEKPPVDKGPKCQLFFLPLDTLQNWKKDPENQKDEHSHIEEHGSIGDGSQGSHSDDAQDWQAIGHHWSEAHAGDYEERSDANEESMDNSPGEAVPAGSALNSARALKSARTMPERTSDQPRPPQGKAPKQRRPQPVVFTGPKCTAFAET